jgi:hypothetical protein
MTVNEIGSLEIIRRQTPKSEDMILHQSAGRVMQGGR